MRREISRPFPSILSSAGAFVALLALFACAAPTARSSAPVSADPVVASPVSQPGPLATPPSRTAAVEGEQRALAEARAHVDAGRHATAARLLRHFLELHPHSLSAVDARWLLGRAHEQLGEWHSALAQYRMIAEAATRPPGLTPAMNTQVRDRIAVMTRLLGRASPSSSGFVALALDPAHFPDPAQWQRWLTPLLAEGVTTLVIDVAPVVRPTGAATDRGVYFPTTWARLERDLFSELVPLAHDLGLTVFASLDVTQLSWLDPTVGWTTSVLDESSKHLAPSLSFDLLHPSVQEYLTGFFSDLARTQVDGLIVLMGSRTGPRYQVSSRGLARFAQVAGIEVDPDKLLRSGRALPAAGRDTTASTDPLAETLWRWAGWQSRERLNVLAHLRSAMRQIRSGLQVTIAFHDVALSNSQLALMEHGEDVLEAAQRGFGIALPLAALSPMASAGPADPPGSGFPERVTQALDFIGAPERLWLLEPVSHLDRASISRLMSLPQAQQIRARGIHLVVTAPGPEAR